MEVRVNRVTTHSKIASMFASCESVNVVPKSERVFVAQTWAQRMRCDNGTFH